MKIIAAVGAIGVALAAIPTLWSITDHYMSRPEIEKAMKAHADHDAAVQSWNQYGFAAQRADFLGDHVFECSTKRMMGALSKVDAAMCARYEAEAKRSTDLADTLKKEAMSSSKEKAAP